MILIRFNIAIKKTGGEIEAFRPCTYATRKNLSKVAGMMSKIKSHMETSFFYIEQWSYEVEMINQIAGTISNEDLDSMGIILIEQRVKDQE